MFSPSKELVDKYSEQVISSDDSQDRRIQELIRDYIKKQLSPDPKTGRGRRVMMLLFKGPDAVRKIRSVVGNINPERRVGETIRDTYGDIVMDDSGKVQYFEPAVLAAPSVNEAGAKLKLWAQYSDKDGGILDNVNAYAPGEKPQRTLVLIKPDNFRFPSGRPGNMIDFFSRTGLYIIGIKVHRMSVAQALNFYGPVRDVLRSKLKDVVSSRAKALLEKEFGIKVAAAEEKMLGETFGPIYGDSQFESIVRFMSGHAPSEVDKSTWPEPGTEKCIAIVYEGVEAVRKIRDVLGPTDPSKAPPGSIRREFGQTIMVNAAHASDSPENAQREMGIVNVGENTFKQVVEQYYGK
jgi:nucleoside diphosphate kinase